MLHLDTRLELWNCDEPVKHHVLKILLAVSASVALAIFAVGLITILKSPNYIRALDEQRSGSNQILVDRNGNILRIEPNEHGEYLIWLKHDQIPQLMKNAVVAAEDKRFYSHFGFDPLATLRAIYSYYTTGKIVSGASTISQQVVRMLNPRPRTLRSKIIEFFAALKLEWQLSKDEILELNLNLAPMGGYLKGVGIASRVYFDKDIKMLSVSESAALAALPRSPSRFDPTKSSGRALLIEEKDRVISRMLTCGFITPEEATRNIGKNLTFRKRRIPRQASHFVQLASGRIESKSPVVRTTLDGDLQKQLEDTLASHKPRLASVGIKQAAAIIVSVKNLSVLALMGSISYGPANGGFNNGAVSRRSGGSTLKPFLYALALEKGLSTASVIPDTSRKYKTPSGDYMPLNANRVEYGPVTLSEALGSSLNLAAVKTIEEIGVREFFKLLETIKILDSNSKSYQHYGYGLAIGNLEVSLFGLTRAYACLARKGNFGELRMLVEEPLITTRVIDAKSVIEITDVLRDHNARIMTFGNPYFMDLGFPVAIKTGTSDGYRDAWTLAFTSEYVVGLWAGNFDGKPSSGVSGANACGPILSDLMHILGGSGAGARGRIGQKSREYGNVHAPDEHLYLGAEYAAWIHKRELNLGTGRYRLESGLMTPENRPRLEEPLQSSRTKRSVMSQRSSIIITTPHDGDQFSGNTSKQLIIPLRASTASVVPYVIWIVNGIELARSEAPYEFYWEPSNGRHSIMAVTPNNEAAKIEIYVE